MANLIFFFFAPSIRRSRSTPPSLLLQVSLSLPKKQIQFMKRHAEPSGSEDETDSNRVEADSVAESDDAGDSNDSESNGPDDPDGSDGGNSVDGPFDPDGSFITQSETESDEDSQVAFTPEPTMSFIQCRRRVRKIIHRYQHIRNQIAVAMVAARQFDYKKCALFSAILDAPGVTVEQVETFEQEWDCRIPYDARAFLSVVNGGANQNSLTFRLVYRDR
jgi:hypothetical protein